MALTGAEVAQIAYQAGFRGDDLVAFVGISYRESRWDPTAHRTDNDPNAGTGDFGLWQINRVHLPRMQQELGISTMYDLKDPLLNAKAARIVFEAAGGYSPWNGSAQGWVADGDPMHGVPLDRAREAVAEAEQLGLLGADWEQGGVGPPSAPAPSPAPTAGADEPQMAARPSHSPEDEALTEFLRAAMAQEGDRYALGGRDLSDPDPEHFDCSGLVQWAANQAGVQVASGSWLQYQEIAGANTELTVEQALQTPGALLFMFEGGDPMSPNRPARAHVAISLGNGEIIHAASERYGVQVKKVTDPSYYTHAGRIPEFGTELVFAETVTTEDIPRDLDSDMDGLRDRLEIYLGTDPYAGDTDRDGFSDLAEVTRFQTDPLVYHSSPIATDPDTPAPTPTRTNEDREIAVESATDVDPITRLGLDSPPSSPPPSPTHTPASPPGQTVRDETPAAVVVPDREEVLDPPAPPPDEPGTDAQDATDDGVDAEDATDGDDRDDADDGTVMPLIDPDEVTDAVEEDGEEPVRAPKGGDAPGGPGDRPDEDGRDGDDEEQDDIDRDAAESDDTADDDEESNEEADDEEDPAGEPPSGDDGVPAPGKGKGDGSGGPPDTGPTETGQSGLGPGDGAGPLPGRDPAPGAATVAPGATTVAEEAAPASAPEPASEPEPPPASAEPAAATPDPAAAPTEGGAGAVDPVEPPPAPAVEPVAPSSGDVLRAQITEEIGESPVPAVESPSSTDEAESIPMPDESDHAADPFTAAGGDDLDQLLDD